MDPTISVCGEQKSVSQHNKASYNTQHLNQTLDGLQNCILPLKGKNMNLSPQCTHIYQNWTSEYWKNDTRSNEPYFLQMVGFDLQAACAADKSLFVTM